MSLLSCFNNTQLAEKKFSDAIGTLQNLIKEIPDDLKLQQNLIWLLATCPDLKARDPEKALALSRKLLSYSEGTTRIGGLVTLASAPTFLGHEKSCSTFH